MVSSSIDGVVCRILLLTAASYSTWNNVTIEFGTPPSSTNPGGMLFCMNDQQFNLRWGAISSVVRLQSTE